MPVDPDTRGPWVPHTDAFVSPQGEFTVKVEIAALRRDDVELGLEGHRLFITGRRADADREAAGTRYFFSEICSGAFELALDIPPGFDLARAKADYQNGLLRVVFPPQQSTSTHSNGQRP
jgi:HSP20 family protein